MIDARRQGEREGVLTYYVKRMPYPHGHRPRLPTMPGQGDKPGFRRPGGGGGYLLRGFGNCPKDGVYAMIACPIGLHMTQNSYTLIPSKSINQ